jgi:hypothetical protein
MNTPAFDAADPSRSFSIVCAYADGELPSAWFQGFRRARRTIRRAGYRARIELLPASAVPHGADVVITSAAVAEMIRSDLGDLRAEFVVAEVGNLPAAFEALFERLLASGALVRGPELRRTVAVHRGFRAVGDRARLSDEGAGSA